MSVAGAGMRRSDPAEDYYRESLHRERIGRGTMRVIFEPLYFIARLTALVPLCALGANPGLT